MESAYDLQQAGCYGSQELTRSRRAEQHMRLTFVSRGSGGLCFPGGTHASPRSKPCATSKDGEFATDVRPLLKSPI